MDSGFFAQCTILGLFLWFLSFKTFNKSTLINPTHHCNHMNNHKWWHGHFPLYWCFENNAVACQHPDFLSAFDIRGQYIYVNRTVMSTACCFNVISWPTWHSGSFKNFLLKGDFNTLHFISPHFPVIFCVRIEIKSGYSCLSLHNLTLVRHSLHLCALLMPYSWDGLSVQDFEGREHE